MLTRSKFTHNLVQKLLQNTLLSVEISDIDRTRALFVSNKDKFGDDLNGK